VTAAYNPRTNGMTERFNQTFIEALRKHAEKDQKKWHKWIPFILLAYNSRKHSSTGFTPFELMFGRKMNKFDDFTSTKSYSEVAELEQRANEIKSLIDKQDQAKAVIAENQEVQKRAQNQALNLSDKVIEPGTLVNIRNDGINSKLDPIFKGPYTVVEMDNKQNYTLKHATGEVLKETIPRQKIKIINKKVDNNTYEVEKILDHKIENNITYYHVKWRGYDETTWEPEVNFNTMGVINKYKRDIKNGKLNTAM